MIKSVLTFADNKILVHRNNVSKVDTEFDSGFYTAYAIDNNLNIEVKDVSADIIEPYNGQEFVKITEYLQKFYDPKLKTLVNKMGFKHKMGILLYGIAGTGKTSYIFYTAEMLVNNHNAIVFICEDANDLSTTMGLIKDIREIQNNPVVIIADEFERWAIKLESEMKNFLDGVNSVDNCLFMAATNYIDKIPDSLRNRESRFKAVFEIKGITDPNIIKNIIVERNKLVNIWDNDQVELMAEQLVGGRPTLDSVKNYLLDKLLDDSLGTFDRKMIGFGVAESPDNEDCETKSLTIGDIWGGSIPWKGIGSLQDVIKYDNDLTEFDSNI